MRDEERVRLANLRSWLAAPLESSAKLAIERLQRTEDVVHIAVMPDVHVAGDVCVGTAMATTRLIYPSAVGGDIGCGMLAIPFDAGADVVRNPAGAGAILRLLGERVPAQRRHRNRTIPLPDDLKVDGLSHGSLQAIARDAGVLQLGTLGSGNHFVEFQADEDDRLWLMIHSGSRAMGQAIRNFHVAHSTVRSGSLVAVDAGLENGQAYLSDQQWARRYAHANRKAMASEVADLMREQFGIQAVDSMAIVCDHNHVQQESHFGELYYVHRKGAMPADATLPGVIPGSMGSESFHVIGKGNAEALRSSAHGAGRQYARGTARKRFSRRELERQMNGVWFDVRLADNLREESPGSYKNVRDVIRAQQELVSITRTLKPVLVYKGR